MASPLSKKLRCSDDSVILMHPLRTDAPWGLGRVSSKIKLANQNSTALAFTYNYDSTGGANSDVYIIGMRAERSMSLYVTELCMFRYRWAPFTNSRTKSHQLAAIKVSLFPM